jgi:5-methylcytosine-specific restriction endonuclease McrA
MQFILAEYHRDISNNDLLDDIKRISLKLQKNTVTIAEYNEYGKFNSSTLQRRFGSWFKVLELAGLKPSRSELNISNDNLFKNIENLWICVGRQPKYNEINKPLSKYSAGTYEKRFGSWLKALKIFVDYIESNDNKSENIVIEDNNHNEIKHKTKREISDRLRFKILMRDGFTCKKCGRSPMKDLKVELHIDHILPWSKGGETIPENLETKCEKCNLGTGNEFNV